MDNTLELRENQIASKINKDTDYKISTGSEYSQQQIFSVLRSYYRQLSPIYSKLKDNILKVIKKADRDYVFLEHNEKPIGILVFKNQLLSEEPCIETKNGYIELKSMFLFDEFGKGHIWKLWETFLNTIQKNYPNADGIYTSVSKKKAPKSLHMFKKMNFQPLYEVYNKYKKDGDSEVYLYCPLSQKLEPRNWNINTEKSDFPQLFGDKETRIGISGEEAQKYKIGDFLTFSQEGKTLKKEIKNNIKYSSLEDYIENISATNLSGIEIIKMHNSIIGNEESIKKCGINGFKCK
ncbi:hypothetical protein D8B45_00050 [Candidatus Gracilibacteria bacterium]|nr:MAG: hypothetical protein D8B45_00050 [Candidatus Gracilibacteria bacterium]